MKIRKLARVEAPKGEFKDVVAFQLVEFTIDYFNNEIVSVLDTRIYKDGTQEVIDGDGFIPAGFKVAA